MDTWIPLRAAAQHEEGPFSGIPASSGVYVLRISLEVGLKKMRKKAETAEETRLKGIYRNLHSNDLPPLVER